MAIPSMAAFIEAATEAIKELAAMPEWMKQDDAVVRGALDSACRRQGFTYDAWLIHTAAEIAHGEEAPQ